MKNTMTRGAGQSPRRRTYGYLRGQWQPSDHYPNVSALLLWLKNWLEPLLMPLMPADPPKTEFPLASLLIVAIVKTILGVRSWQEFIPQWAYASEVLQILGWPRFLNSQEPLKHLWQWCKPANLDRLLAVVVGQLLVRGYIKGRVLILDTSYFHVWGHCYEGATRGRSGQLHRQILGYKVWIIFDADSRLPIAIHVAPGNESDFTCALQVWRKALQNLGKQRVQVLLMDRGFHSQKLWNLMQLQARHVTLICRVRRGTHEFDRRAAQLKRRATVVCAGYRCAAGAVKRGQIVWIHRPQFKNPMVLWTNNCQWSASQVYRAYTQRGRIERWIKTMKEDWQWGHFPGTRQGAVMGQIYLTAVAYLVQRMFQQAYSRKTHRWGIRRFRREVYEALDPLPFRELLSESVPLDRIRRNLRVLMIRLAERPDPVPEEFSSIAATITPEVSCAA